MTNQLTSPSRTRLCVALVLSMAAYAAYAQSPGRGLPTSPIGSQRIGPETVATPAPTGLSMLAGEELVADIRVEGNKTIPAPKITAQLSTRVGRPFDSAALARDVRKLASMPWFVSVRPYSERTENGRIVILRVVERSTVRYVSYLGNSKLKDKKLAKETGLKEGAAVDPYLVEDGRRKILAAYADAGFPNAQVTILEGDQADDRGIVYVINEGVKQKIWKVQFEGNDSDFASDRRLKTRVQTKPGYFYLIGGNFNRETLDGDLRKLTEYYRAFGFFQAKVGRTLEFGETGEWVTVKFVIHEGPRYEVRTVRYVGNEKFGDDSLALGAKLPQGEFFEQAKMNADVEWLKEVYGSQGYVFADVKAEPVFLEEPGKIDLVYHIDEGKKWRVGRIFVHIDGENPHTRIQTALNRLSLRPGEIMDIRELRASERRLQASQLFLTDPARGVSPKITYRIPELDDTEFVASGGGAIRGQSPQDESWIVEQLKRPGRRLYQAFSRQPQQPSPEQTLPPVDVHIELPDAVDTAAPGAPVQDDAQPDAANQRLSPGAQFSSGGPSIRRLPPVEEPVHRHVAYKPPITERSAWQSANRPVHAAYADLQLPPTQQIRGQSPQQAVYQQPYGGTVPRATSPASAPVAPAQPVQPVQYEQYQPSQQPVYEPQPAYAPPTGGGFPPPPAAAPPGYPPPGYPAPTSPSDIPPAGTPYPPTPQIPSTTPDPALFPNQGFATGEPAVDLHVQLAEAQTGRFMVGVGVNSDAGVVGQIMIDERNFDWRRIPTSWQDVVNGTAFRGGGQSFRIEAAPGTQVQRYLMSFTNPYLFDTPISLSLSGSFYDRRYTDWDEQRLGGRVSLGYQWTENDLTARLTYRGENVNIHDANTIAVPELAETVGDNSLNGFGVVIANDTRNNPFFATDGHYVELQLEQVVGSFNYPRAVVDARKYFLLNERPDHSGRHVLVAQTRLGFTGDDTPVYDRFFAGGYSTMRGFDFRGASPRAGGDFMFLNTLEYLFPLTADDMVNGVCFCDFGTVEDSVTIDTWRVAPGVGLRIQVPAMGPAPIALDFAWPVSRADTDELQVFTFNVGFMR
ncbi:Outer membrane protein assembly factor BamA precursor [Posidoniimonas corsicana]|uniref:Outer membrane protein assembly factor BamA n=1 Tax=Posidoniimonas corsicana TaxID=1938618 RepID=A0A5C5VE66_9BACT|nr:BamA/TamA family outer membrane protein [Posidoniimonas corsicana]TWT36916.1 Outer membrane protein assembly factor BamA precursor [Posidoniimonas corsicana]